MFRKAVALLTLFSILSQPGHAALSPSIGAEEMFFSDLSNAGVASFVLTDSNKQPVSMTTVSQDQIRLSGARTLGEVLQTYVPGFFLIEDQDDTIAGFRGLGPDNNAKVMLLVNGQRMNTEWFWGPPDAIFSSTNMDWIDHVEVIRGPGSVTLGQGALLGVINVVAKKGKVLTGADQAKSSFSVGGGQDKAQSFGMDTTFKQGDVTGYLYASPSRFEGQKLRNEAWAKNKANDGYKGGRTSQIGTRLRRTDNTTAVGNVQYKDFEVNMLYVDQIRDLYNFYRDRNRAGERLASLDGQYQRKLTDNLTSTTRAFLTRDDFSLWSVDGVMTGGTREDRYGASERINHTTADGKNKLAVGVELNRYEYGKQNNLHVNFIVNNLSTTTLASLPTANATNTLGYPGAVNVFSLFAEDSYSLSKTVDLFAGVRFDKHPNWGSHISPRVGGFFAPSADTVFRLSYQSGFRGAVGLHYGGGYRNDGFLRAENYGKVAAAIAGESNLSKVQPEKMDSFELSANKKLGGGWSTDSVAFYNVVHNVIDVGVLYNAGGLPSIGSDVPGDWNGYWYYKNTKGNIREYGVEPSLTYAGPKASVTLSHAIAKVAGAGKQQVGSMYLGAGRRFKAFPENVTRLNAALSPLEGTKVLLNYMYYYSWYSPRDTKVASNHVTSLSVLQKVGGRVEVTASVKNLFNDYGNSSPMNSNAGGADLSDGSPAYEKRTFWLTGKFLF